MLFVVSHLLSATVSPEWRLNPGFWTQKSVPFPEQRCPFNRGNRYKKDNVGILYFRKNNHQFLKKSKNQPLTFFMGNLPIRMKNYVSTSKLKFETYFRILPALGTSYNVIRSLFLHQFFQACFTVSVQTWQNLWFLKLFHTNSTSQAFSNFF